MARVPVITEEGVLCFAFFFPQDENIAFGTFNLSKWINLKNLVEINTEKEK